jgi:hypothetical protein
MKTVLILALALIALASTCVAFTPTSEDLAWAMAVDQDLAIIISDANFISTAASARDQASIKKYSDLFAEDAGNALWNSQSYPVSPEFQKAKNYYELAFSSYQIGAQKTLLAFDLNDTKLMQDGIADIFKGAEYRDLVLCNINFAN